MRKILISCFLCISPLFIIGAKRTEDTLYESKKISHAIALQHEGVISGDTFLAGGRLIRLWGIAAPKEGANHFFASKLYLEVILESAPYSCNYKYTDKKNETLVMQCFSDKKDVASLLTRMGMAKDLEKLSYGTYQKDENFARHNKYGIWGN